MDSLSFLIIHLYLEPLLNRIGTPCIERAVHLGDHSVEHELSVYRVLGIVGEVFQEALASQSNSSKVQSGYI